MNNQAGLCTVSIRVNPSTPLNLSSRTVGTFQLNSINADIVEATTTHPDAERDFRSQPFLGELERLAWDLVWEQLVAVQFELPGDSQRVTKDQQWREIININMEQRIDFNPGNRKSGLDPSGHFDLLQRIRDHVIKHHVAGNDQPKTAKLMGDAPTILAIEHFVKGVVNRQYAFVEFYSVLEIIAHQTAGGRKALESKMTKATIDKIAKYANDAQLDQRHGPKDPQNVQPLPPNAIEDAANVAKTLIIDYTGTVV